MPAPPRFVADVMVGKLARWLRILGYDVRYSNRFEDAEILELAQSEQRVILTRDTGLIGRCGERAAVLIEGDGLDRQLLQLAREQGLKPLDLFSRCLECNRVLEEESKESVVGRVPSYVHRTQDRFRSCPECGRIYWPGTHGDNVRERIDRCFGTV